MIPEDWLLPNLGSLFTFKNGLNKAKNYFGYGDPIVNYMDVYNHDGLTPCQIHGRVDVSNAELNSFRVKKGDVFFTRTSETVDEIGISSVLLEDSPNTVFSGFVLRARPKSDSLDNQFKKYCFSSAMVREQIASQSTYTTRALTNGRVLSRMVVPVPPTKAEQVAIAEALSDADAYIESLEKLIAKKRLIKQGVMQELLTGKRRLPGFSGEWRKTAVGQVIVNSFSGPSPTCEERNIRGMEWGVLKTTAVTWENGWDWRKHKTLPKAYWNKTQSEIKFGDVVVTKAGPRHRVGVAAWVDEIPSQVLVSGKMIGLRPDMQRVLPLMLSSAIAHLEAQQYLDQRTTGMAESQVNFENEDLLTTPIKLPEMKEQRAIAAIIESIDSEINALKNKLSKACNLKQGMMQELLTGRIRLV